MTHAVRAAIKEVNMMNTGDTTYKITRRDAMCELASIPMIALGQKQSLHTRRYGEMLRYCTAALEGCWELYRSSDAIGTRYAFECVSTCVSLLENIARDSSQHRKEALDLATQYALLQTMLGWGRAHPWKTVDYAQKALTLSKATGNILLQLSAYTKLSYTYLTAKQPTKAWEVMREGEHMLKEHQGKKNVPLLPTGMIGNFNSSYSMAQVSNGILPDTALGIATDSEPLKERIALVEFTAFDQWWEAAWTCCTKGDPKQTMMWLKKLISLDTLASCSDVPQSERERIGVVNVLTHVLLQSQERDMKEIIRVWTVGMEGAQVLKNEARYQEAIVNLEIMRYIWPGEQRIIKLVPLTAHW